MTLRGGDAVPFPCDLTSREASTVEGERSGNEGCGALLGAVFVIVTRLTVYMLGVGKKVRGAHCVAEDHRTGRLGGALERTNAERW